MADLNKQALEMWNSMKPMIDREIEQQTKGAVQRKKAKVTTAPSLVTKKIGVTEPFGDQYFIPYDAKVAGAKVGDVVWVEYMYGASNAFASMFAKAVEDPKSCSATLSSAGWYRVMQTEDVAGTIINFYIGRPWDSNPAEAHKISFYTVGSGKSAFLDETSDTNTLCVDKIRATYGGGLVYFDVHYNASSANEVLVYFDVYGKGQANGTSIAMGLESVADAPSGETVLVTHNFQSNNALWQSATITPTLYNLAGSITLNGNSIWYKSDKSVLQFSTIANINITSRTGGNGGFKFNLPFEYNGPTKDIYVGTQSKFSNEFVYIHLTNGSSEVIVGTTETHSNITTGAVRYLVSQVTLFMN